MIRLQLTNCVIRGIVMLPAMKLKYISDNVTSTDVPLPELDEPACVMEFFGTTDL